MGVHISANNSPYSLNEAKSWIDNNYYYPPGQNK